MHETIQLAEHSSRRQVGTPRDLTSMQRLVRGEQQEAQHATPVAGEKNRCQGLLHNWQRLSLFLQQARNGVMHGR
jgi:hypothetical protein